MSGWIGFFGMSAHFRHVALGIILLAVFVTSATSCKKQVAEVKNAEVEPWPIAAIWAWGDHTFGQESYAPSLVIYSDGRLILKKVSRIDGNPPAVSLWTKVLSSEELADLQGWISLAAKDLAADDLSESFDESGATFYFGAQGKGLMAGVSGVWLRQPDDALFLNTLAESTTLPDSLFRFCACLPSLVRDELEPWKPKQLEVEFRLSLTDRVNRPHWPENWPGPESPGAARCDERKFVVLEMKELADLQKLLGTERCYDFVEIEVGGKKVRANYYTHFPGEELWRSEFRVIDLDSFVQPVGKVTPPVVPKPVLPKRVDLK